MSEQTAGPIFVATWDFGALAVREAWTHWRQTSDLGASCVAGTAAVESDPAIPTVGIGGLPNRDGVVELDAGMMRGSDLRCGSVASLRVTCPAIRVAQAVAEQTNHVMLAGRGADAFALQQGCEPVAPDAMLTEETRSQYEAWRARVEAGEIDEEKMVGHDTVCVLGWHAGETVACVATSGLGYKRAGRVGDSPIIGGGLYADDQAGCAASTGIGEELYRHAVSIRVTDAMHSGADASGATGGVLRRMIERDPANRMRGLTLLAIDRQGGIGVATTRTDNHEFELHVCRAGEFERVVPTPIV
ncbi:MAG: isoaspartyl peptidase/L-asparaginase [Phycisphaeraceae bacterium]|nr:isoaspartyl peptidase/L-asparaginase [Phycisphaeraceae bacterium]